MPTGTGLATEVAYWGAASTLTGEAAFFYTAGTNTLNVGNVILPDAGYIGNSATTARLVFDSSLATDYATFRSCYVGIGAAITTPVCPLEVEGTLAIAWNSAVQSYGNVTLGTGGTGGSLWVNTASLSAAYQSGLGIEGTYNIGDKESLVGLTAYGVKSGGGYHSEMALSVTNGTTIYEVIRIDGDRNVGIGTTTPAARLEVQTIAATIGQIVQGAAAQTADMFQVQDSAANIHHSFSLPGATDPNTYFNKQLGDSDTIVAGDTEANLLRVDAGADDVRLGDWDTNYFVTDKLGDSWWVGGGGLQFAEIYYMGAGFATVLAAQNTYYQILGFDTDGESNGAVPDHTNDHITVAKDGKYCIQFSLSCRSAAANVYQFMVKKNNGTANCANIMVHRTTATANRMATGACMGICDLTAADTIELWVQRTDGLAVAKTITIEHVVLNLVQVGG